MADDRTDVRIDVISDVVCPWCFVGKRRLARALDLMPEVAADVNWRPFRLDPTIPPEGIERDAYLTKKFGPDGAREMHGQIAAIGEEEGIVFRFDRIARSPNTVDAHRLILWAGREAQQQDVVEALFTAYFSEGRDIGDPAVLADIAAETGMPEGTGERLAGDDDRAETVAEVENAYRIGVSGVPAFIIDQRIAVMGAYPPEAIVQAVGQSLEERNAART